MARLRRHAEARDWVVVAEVIDHAATAAPLNRRPNWPQAKTYITNGQARGIVATPHTVDADAASFPTLTEWLRDQHAFLSEDAPTAEGAVR